MPKTCGSLGLLFAMYRGDHLCQGNYISLSLMRAHKNRFSNQELASKSCVAWGGCGTSQSLLPKNKGCFLNELASAGWGMGGMAGGH